MKIRQLQIPRKKIFLIEDSELFSFMVDYELKHHFRRHLLYTFDSGELCLEHLQLSPDIVILDYYLPGINGDVLLHEIRNSPYCTNTKVIMLSNLTDMERVCKLMKDGADEFIEKGKNSPSSIVKIIAKWVA